MEMPMKRFVKPRSPKPKCKWCGAFYEEAFGGFDLYDCNGEKVCIDCLLGEMDARFTKKQDCECEKCGKKREVYVIPEEDYYEIGYETICEDCLTELKRL